MKTNSLQSTAYSLQPEPKREREENACMLTLTGIGVLAGTLMAGWLVAVLEIRWPAVACAAKLIGGVLLALALWICAWECGRRFEAEHGKRICGCRPEDEETGRVGSRQWAEGARQGEDHE